MPHGFERGPLSCCRPEGGWAGIPNSEFRIPNFRLRYPDDLPSARSHVAAAAICRPARPGGGGANAHQRPSRRHFRPGLSVLRIAGRRQDHRRPAARQGRQLLGGTDRRAVRRVRLVPGDYGRLEHRRDRDGWRLQSWHRRRAGIEGASPVSPNPRPLPRDHHRRSPHAHPRSLQRPAQEPRGTAPLHPLDLRHDRTPQGPGHHPLALPAARVSAGRYGAHPRSAVGDRGRRGLHARAVGCGRDCRRGGGQRARCAVAP